MATLLLPGKTVLWCREKGTSEKDLKVFSMTDDDCSGTHVRQGPEVEFRENEGLLTRLCHDAGNHPVQYRAEKLASWDSLNQFL